MVLKHVLTVLYSNVVNLDTLFWDEIESEYQRWEDLRKAYRITCSIDGGTEIKKVK